MLKDALDLTLLGAFLVLMVVGFFWVSSLDVDGNKGDWRCGASDSEEKEQE